MDRSALLAGAIAGCVATAPMTATMEMLYQRLPQHEKYPLPPSQITTGVVEERVLQTHLDQPEHVRLTLFNHYAYGALAGALYGQLASRLPFSPAINGVAFGLAVWAVSYQGWLPALNILPPATEHPANRNALMIAAHVVWGSVTGIVADRLRQIAE